MNQFHPFRYELIKAVAYDGVCLSPADFHDPPPGPFEPVDIGDQGSCQLRVPVFTQELHL